MIPLLTTPTVHQLPALALFVVPELEGHEPMTTFYDVEDAQMLYAKISKSTGCGASDAFRDQVLLGSDVSVCHELIGSSWIGSLFCIHIALIARTEIEMWMRVKANATTMPLSLTSYGLLCNMNDTTEVTVQYRRSRFA